MAPEAQTRPLPIWKGVLFSLIVIVGVFGGVEAALWKAGYPPRKTLDTALHNNSFWITQSDLTDSPFLHKEVGTEFKVSTNDYSMRYRKVPIGRQSGVLRIMALGDSTTFGWGVDQGLTYPDVLETLLKDKVPGMEVQSINGGVPGYSTFQGLHHMRERVLRYESDIYLIGYIVQDARRAPVSDKDQAISNRSAEFFKANPLYRWRTYLWIRNQYQVYRSAKREEEAKEGETWRVPPEEYRENLTELVQMVRSSGAIPVLFGFPLEVIGYTAQHREVLAQVAQDLQTPTIDLSAPLAEAARKQTLYFPADRGHPNAAGCQVIAEELAKWLEGSGVLKAAAERRK